MLEPDFETRKKLYEENFGVSFLDASIEERLAVIGLICNVTHGLQMKKPGINCYKVIMKIMENTTIPSSALVFFEGLAIMCEDVMRNATEFSDFGIKTGKERISKIREILNKYLPF